MKFQDFFLSKNIPLEQAAAFSLQLEENCPWLDFEEGVSEPIAEELISDAFKENWPAGIPVYEFVNWYNDKVARLTEYASPDEIAAAYTELCDVAAEFGKEDAFGGGDFWIVSDSFSHSAPSIVWYSELRDPKGLANALLAWKRRHPLFYGLKVIDREGDEKLKLEG